MKKIIAILIVMTMMFSLASCGNKIEKMKANAIEIEWEDLINEYKANGAAAQIKYKEQPIKFTDHVLVIGSSFLEISIHTSKRSGLVKIFMDKEDLAKLSKNKTYTFIGYFDGNSVRDAIVVE